MRPNPYIDEFSPFLDQHADYHYTLKRFLAEDTLYFSTEPDATLGGAIQRHTTYMKHYLHEFDAVFDQN